MSWLTFLKGGGGNLEGRLLGIKSLNSSKRSMSFVRWPLLISESESINSFMSTRSPVSLSASEIQARKPCSPLRSLWQARFPEMKLISTPEGSSRSDSWIELASSRGKSFVSALFTISLEQKSTEGLFLVSQGFPRMSSYFPNEKTGNVWVSPNSPKTIFKGFVRLSCWETVLPSAKVTESFSSEHVPSRLCLSTKFWAMKSWVDPESTRKTAFFPASFPVKRSNSCWVSVSLTRRLLISGSESWLASSSLSLLLLRVRCLSRAVLAAGGFLWQSLARFPRPRHLKHRPWRINMIRSSSLSFGLRSVGRWRFDTGFATSVLPRNRRSRLSRSLTVMFRSHTCQPLVSVFLTGNLDFP